MLESGTMLEAGSWLAAGLLAVFGFEKSPGANIRGQTGRTPGAHPEGRKFQKRGWTTTTSAITSGCYRPQAAGAAGACLFSENLSRGGGGCGLYPPGQGHNNTGKGNDQKLIRKIQAHTFPHSFFLTPLLATGPT